MLKISRGVLALAASAVLILWLGQYTDIDLRLADMCSTVRVACSLGSMPGLPNNSIM